MTQPTTQTTDVTYRWIDGDSASDADWFRIETILDVRGWMRLSRTKFTRIRVAERGGELLGFYVCQLIPHAEPLYVKPSERATGLADTLADDMMEYLTNEGARGWLVVADSPFAEKMASSRGMHKIESPVYVKVN